MFNGIFGREKNPYIEFQNILKFFIKISRNMAISALTSVRCEFTMNLHSKILSFIRHESIDLERLIKIGLIRNSLLSTKKKRKNRTSCFLLITIQ